ncbi:MAG TPA: OsmC family protein [archaeon]|nr:OsmC family protein [archaeon]
MPKISSGFKPYAEQWLMNLNKIQSPSQGIGTIRSDATLIGDQASEAILAPHRLISDEPAVVGGSDKGPGPLDYFMASVGFCENVTFARYAVLEGLDFDSLQTSVRGHWDRRGQGEFSDVEPSFKDFVVETRITSADSVEKIKRVVTIVHRRCPMHSTIAKVGRVVDRLFVNGSEVPL